MTFFSFLFKKNMNKLLVLIISIFVFGVLVFIKVGKKLNDKIIYYSEIKSEKVVRMVLNNVICHDNSLPNVNELYIINFNSLNEIQSIDFNTSKVNEYISNVNVKINNIFSRINEEKFIKEYLKKNNYLNLRLDNNSGIIIGFPIGIMYDNALLNNLGPKIPIKIEFDGNFEAYLTSKIVDYGINNSLVNVLIKYRIKYNIILPMKVEEKITEADVPILVKIISGKVPDYYSSNIKENSNLITH